MLLNSLIMPNWPHAFVGDQSRPHGTTARYGSSAKKRDRMARSLPEWEQLRSTAAQIKAHVLSRLPQYLEQFEQAASPRCIRALGERRGRT